MAVKSSEAKQKVFLYDFWEFLEYKKTREYDKEMPHSHPTVQPMVPQGRDAEY